MYWFFMSLIAIATTSCSIIGGASASSQSTSIREESLAVHNKWRKAHQVSPLVWNQTLANAAERHASKCWFQHSIFSSYGENLAAGYPSISTAVNAWYAEKQHYSYQHPGFSHRTGHFTQVVWKGSKKLGCAYAVCNGKHGTPGKYWVCEYSPAGNITNSGYFAANVSDPH
jgi:uncharacterized protein YkwD